MNGQPITFNELRDMIDMHMQEAPLEILADGNVYRGKISKFTWWPHHPHQITWDENQMWDDKARVWKEQEPDVMAWQFPFNAHEYFTGPFVAESGEIFFMTDTTYVTIFPNAMFSSDFPRKEASYRQIRERMF